MKTKMDISFRADDENDCVSITDKWIKVNLSWSGSSLEAGLIRFAWSLAKLVL